MIQKETQLQAMDNSGARIIQCIHAFKGSYKSYAYCSDFILVSIRTLRLIRKVKRGEIFLGIITRTKKNIKFKDGSTSKFNKNTLILLNKQKKILGTRIFGPISRKLRKKKYLRFLLIGGKKIY